MSTKIKGNLRVDGDLEIPLLDADSVLIADANKEIKSSPVTATELGYLDGVTSSIQDQINSKADATDLADYIPVTDKGVNNGVATLDAGGKIPASQIPAMAITETFVVADEVAMLALDAQTGDVAIRSDISQTFILQGSDPTELSDWVQLQTPASPVLSVNGEVGTVVLDTDDIAEGATNLYYTDARAKAAAVADAIVDGVTDVAPSQNAVFDALANKADASDLSDYLPLAGGTMTGDLTLAGAPDADLKAATKKYVDDSIASIPSGFITAVENSSSMILDVSELDDEQVLTAHLRLSSDNADSGYQKVNAVTGVIEEGMVFQLADSSIKSVAVINSLAGSETDRAPSVASVNAAISSLDVGANKTLSNLEGPTAINQNLLPSTALSQNIGSGLLPFNDVMAASFSLRTDGLSGAQIRSQNTTPSGSSNASTFSANYHTAVVTTNQSASNSSQMVSLETGNTVNGNSGNISLRPGVPTGTGTRGYIDATSAQIKNVQDPVAAQDAATKAYVDSAISGNVTAGDIPLTAFSGANNVTVPADVTGFVFDTAEVRGFKALVTVAIDADSEVYETFEIIGSQGASGFNTSRLSIMSTGDDSDVVFSITALGQVQYTSPNASGFNSLEIQFRATVTHI